MDWLLPSGAETNVRFVPALVLSLTLFVLGWAPTARAVSCGPGEVMGDGDLVWSPFNAVQLWPVPPVTGSGDSGRAIQFVADAATYTLGVQLIGVDESQPTQGKDYVVSECPHNFNPVGGKASCTAIGAGSYAEMYLRFGFGTQTYYDCPLTHGTTYYINFRDYFTPRGSVSSQFVIYNRTDGGPIAPTTCTLTATPASIDAGVTSALTASCSPAATSFAWTGGTCVGTTGASCTVMPLVTTTYSVAEINSGGTGVPVNVTVTVAPLPTCTLTATKSILEVNGPTTLTASCSPAGTSLSWTGGTCVGTTGASCTVMPSATTTYTVAGINRVGTAGPIASVTVTGTSTPTCTLTATPASIFAGGTSTLTANCSSAATSFVWTGGTCVGTTGASCTVMPLVTTNYTAAGINAFGAGKTASAAVTVMPAATPAPVCTLTAAPASIAAGGTSTLSASCSPTATSYVWTGGTCFGVTAAICAVTPTASTSYTVAGRNAGGTGAAVSATVTVTPTSAPTITGVSLNHGSATISFTTLPQFTSYTVTCTAADQTTRTATGTSSPITVQGLTGGVPYSCAVTASNGTTTSAPSATVPVTARSIVPMMMQLLFD